MSSRRGGHGLDVAFDNKRRGNKKYRARLFFKGPLDLGRYCTAHEARLAYDQAVRSLCRTLAQGSTALKLSTNYAEGVYKNFFPQVQAAVTEFIKKHPELQLRPAQTAGTIEVASSSFMCPQTPGPFSTHNIAADESTLSGAAVAGHLVMNAAAAPEQQHALSGGQPVVSHQVSASSDMTDSSFDDLLAVFASQQVDDGQLTSAQPALLPEPADQLADLDSFMDLLLSGEELEVPEAATAVAPVAAQLAAGQPAFMPAALPAAAPLFEPQGAGLTFMGLAVQHELVQFTHAAAVQLLQLYNQLLLLPSSQGGLLLVQWLATARQTVTSSYIIPATASDTKVRQAVMSLLSRLALTLAGGGAGSSSSAGAAPGMGGAFGPELMLLVVERLLCAMMQLKALCSDGPLEPLTAAIMQSWHMQLLNDSSMPAGQVVLSLVQQLQS